MLKTSSVGTVLKESRKRSNLTQQELSNISYLSRQAISKYELDISQISVERFVMLLDTMNTSVLIKDGKIEIIEVKNMKTFGYLKINAITAKYISSNMNSFINTLKENGLTPVNIFELDDYIKSIDSNYSTLDAGLYLTLDFKNSNITQECIKDPFYNGYTSYSLIEDLLKKIEQSLNMDESSLSCYLSPFKYEEIHPEVISFADTDLIDNKLKSLYENFCPQKYDIIFPNQRAGYLRVKKNDKYGFIDYRTGKEVVPCKFDFVTAFDFFNRNESGEMLARARYKGKWVTIKRNGELY